MCYQIIYDSAGRGVKLYDGATNGRELSVGDRILPRLIPPAGVPIDADPTEYGNYGDHPEFQFKSVVRGTDTYGEYETAVLYEPDAEAFVQVGHRTPEGANRYQDVYWKVIEIGSKVRLDDLDKFDPGENGGLEASPREFVAEWVRELFEEAIRDGDISGQVEHSHGSRLDLHHPDGHQAICTVELVD